METESGPMTEEEKWWKEEADRLNKMAELAKSKKMTIKTDTLKTKLKELFDKLK